MKLRLKSGYCQTLWGATPYYSSEDAVEISRGVVEQIIGDVVAVRFYEPGSWGPTEADNLAKDVGGWRKPE